MWRALIRKGRADIMSRPLQNVLLLVVIGVGAATLTLSMTISGAQSQSVESWVEETNAAHVWYSSDPDTLDSLAERAFVEEYSGAHPALNGGTLLTGAIPHDLSFHGIDPASTTIAFGAVRAGRWPADVAAGTATLEAALDPGLARELDLALGDTISVATRGGVFELDVVGLIVPTSRVPYPVWSTAGVFVTPDAVDTLGGGAAAGVLQRDAGGRAGDRGCTPRHRAVRLRRRLLRAGWALRRGRGPDDDAAQRASADRRGGWGFLNDIAEGVRYIRGRPSLLVIVLSYLVVSLTVFPYFVFYAGIVDVVFESRTLPFIDSEAVALSVLVGVGSIGAFAASVFVAGIADRGHAFTLFIGTNIAFALVLYAIAPTFEVLILVAIALNALSATFASLGQSLGLRYAHRNFHGRIPAVLTMTLGLTGFAALGYGQLADQVFGLREALLGMSGIGLVAVVGIALYARRINAWDDARSPGEEIELPPDSSRAATAPVEVAAGD